MGEKTNKGLVIALGMLMIFSGFIAIGSPFMMGAMMTTIIGIMLVIGGVSEVVIAFSNGWKEGLPVFLAGILTIIAGAVVFGNPLLASAVFTFLMVGYFIAEGILRAMSAFKLRPTQGWGLILCSGIISILLGIMLMRGWPVSGMMAIGIFAGLRLLIGGINMLTVATAPTPE